MAHGLTQDMAGSLLDLEPTSLLEFFLIYYNWPEDEDSFIALHAGQNGVDTKIIWQSIEYLPFNIRGSNWEIKGDSSMSRPHIVVPNKGYLVSSLLRKYNNMNGCKVVRKRTFSRFLDDANFPDNENPYGAADPNAGFADEKFYISHVISENKSQVEFELVTPLELENIKIPNRRIHSSFCPFIYRGHGCRYNGFPIADIDNKIYVLEGDSIDSYNILTLDAENYANDGISDRSRVDRGTYENQTAFNFNTTGLYSGIANGLYPSGVTSPVLRGDYAIQLNDGGILINPSGDYTAPVYDNFTHSDNLTKFTAMSWLYPLSGIGDTAQQVTGGARAYQTVMDIGDATGGFILRYVADGVGPHKLQTEFKNVSGTNDISIFASPNRIDYNNFQHAAITFNEGNVRLYENAKIVASGSVTGADSERIPKMVTSLGAHGFGMTFFDHAGVGGDVGTTQDSNVDHFSGVMDDTRFYNAVASTAEIENVYYLRSLGFFSHSQLNDRGLYNADLTYNRGDTTFIEGKKYKMLSRNTDDGFDGIKILYICMVDGTTTDPRNDSVNWVRDACGKSIKSCSLRFGNSRVLPFGGFPGTQKYPFQSSSNGY